MDSDKHMDMVRIHAVPVNTDAIALSPVKEGSLDKESVRFLKKGIRNTSYRLKMSASRCEEAA